MGWGEGGEGQEEWVDCHNSVPFHLAIVQVACSTCSGREDGTKKSEQEKTDLGNIWMPETGHPSSMSTSLSKSLTKVEAK